MLKEKTRRKSLQEWDLKLQSSSLCTSDGENGCSEIEVPIESLGAENNENLGSASELECKEVSDINSDQCTDTSGPLNCSRDEGREWGFFTSQDERQRCVEDEPQPLSEQIINPAVEGCLHTDIPIIGSTVVPRSDSESTKTADLLDGITASLNSPEPSESSASVQSPEKFGPSTQITSSTTVTSGGVSLEEGCLPPCYSSGVSSYRSNDLSTEGGFDTGGVEQCASPLDHTSLREFNNLHTSSEILHPETPKSYDKEDFVGQIYKKEQKSSENGVACTAQNIGEGVEVDGTETEAGTEDANTLEDVQVEPLLTQKEEKNPLRDIPVDESSMSLLFDSVIMMYVAVWH